MRRASSRSSAPAGAKPPSSWSTSRSRGIYTGSSLGTVTSRRPRGASPLSRVRVCELRRFILKPSPTSSRCGFHPKPVIECDFHHTGCGKFRSQCRRQPLERLFRRRSSNAQHPSFRCHFESCEPLHCCRGREHFRRLWRLRKCGYREFHDLRAGHERRSIAFGQPGCRDTNRRQSAASSHSFRKD